MIIPSDSNYLFLFYINSDAYPWVVSFRVPYGTYLGQVRDLDQQKWLFNMAIGEYKVLLISKKTEKMMQPSMNTYEIILMISYA